MITKTIEERKTRKVHAAGEAAGRTLCGRLIGTVSVTRNRALREVTCELCRRSLGQRS
jgi:hypothetical protein